MKTFKTLSIASLTLGLASFLVGCGNQQSTSTSSAPGDTSAMSSTDAPPASNISLNGAGATFPYPLYSRWFDQFGTKTGIKINYQSVGSGAGIKQVTAGTVDFGASDAPLKDSDKKAMPSPVVELPMVAGAVVVAFNVPGVMELKLSGPVVAEIFMGKIKKWNDPKIGALNSGATLPDTNVTVAYRSDGSGTTSIFTKYLSAVSPEWKDKVGDGKSVTFLTGTGAKGNDGVSSTIKSVPGAVGYIELAYAKQSSMTYAAIKNSSGAFVIPDAASTTAAAEGATALVAKNITASIANAPGAKAYPISAFTYLIVYKTAKDPAKGEALKKFLEWAFVEGQESAAALDYAPLPASIVALNQKTLAELK